MDKIIIAVDLGHFRAYRVKHEPLGKGKIELIESYDSLEAHGKLLDKLSDQAGRFKMSGKKNGATKVKGYGEPHNLKTEVEKKLTRLIARDIEALLSREGNYDRWLLAAPDGINSRIIESISADIKTKLDKNIYANLTNFKKLDILKHFEAA